MARPRERNGAAQHERPGRSPDVVSQSTANAIGTLLGAVFVGIILNGLTMANLPYYAQDLVKGLVLAAALVITFSLRRDRA